jgi:hypothetical protein
VESEVVPPPEPPWARRMVHSCLLVLTLVLLWWVAGIAALYVPLYEQLELRQLPLPTAVLLKLAGLLHPAVLITWVAVGLALVVAGHFGAVDRALLPLIIAELVLDALLVFAWLVAIPGPAREIQEKLSG